MSADLEQHLAIHLLGLPMPEDGSQINLDLLFKPYKEYEDVEKLGAMDATAIDELKKNLSGLGLADEMVTNIVNSGATIGYIGVIAQMRIFAAKSAKKSK